MKIVSLASILLPTAFGQVQWCPEGYQSIAQNLDGKGKSWSRPHPDASRTIEQCAEICNGRSGCTGFEFAVGRREHGACGTYTGGSSNKKRNENRLNAGSNWRSCIKTEVTCAMTVDNKIVKVSYDGKTLTPIRGKGKEGDWTKEKRYKFTPKAGVKLIIHGEEYSNCDGTKCSGLAMECHDPAGGAWANFGSDTKNCQADTGNMCPTSSGFRLTTNGFSDTYHQKIWPCHGGKSATFSCAPPQVTCAMTVDNKIVTVSYDGVKLNAIRGKGKEGDWTKEKRYQFTPKAGVSLIIHGEEYGNCQGTKCSGLAMECHDPSGGAWEKFGSDTNNCQADTGNMCKTTSGFSLTTNGFTDTVHQKIWPCHDGKSATFSCAPLTASPTKYPTTRSPTKYPTKSPTQSPTGRCDANNCMNWSCADWCECYDESKVDVYNTHEDCQDDNEDTCICFEQEKHELYGERHRKINYNQDAVDAGLHEVIDGTNILKATKQNHYEGRFTCDKTKRFVHGAPYHQWSSYTTDGGEAARTLCHHHWTAEEKPHGWWFQYYANGHFNCAKFTQAVTQPASAWESTHGRPEEVCVPTL